MLLDIHTRIRFLYHDPMTLCSRKTPYLFIKTLISHLFCWFKDGMRLGNKMYNTSDYHIVHISRTKHPGCLQWYKNTRKCNLIKALWKCILNIFKCSLISGLVCFFLFKGVPYPFKIGRIALTVSSSLLRTFVCLFKTFFPTFPFN